MQTFLLFVKIEKSWLKMMPTRFKIWQKMRRIQNRRNFIRFSDLFKTIELD